MKPDVCIYHGSCADGFTAAWAVWRRWGDTVQFIPGVHGKPTPDVSGKHVLMVDFSYRADVTKRIARTARSVTILDHHKSADEELSRIVVRPAVLTWNSPFSKEPLETARDMMGSNFLPPQFVFDVERSGAMLAWNFCFPEVPPPMIVRYVQDRDLWLFKMPDSREINAFIFAHDYTWQNWNSLASSLDDDDGRLQAVFGGVAIEKKHHKDIAELLKITRRPMVIGGHRIEAANLPYTMASDAASLLAQGALFGACYFDRNDGKRVFSLRSRDGGADVSEIARIYGGGGHLHAAGFEAPAGWEGDA